MGGILEDERAMLKRPLTGREAVRPANGEIAR